MTDLDEKAQPKALEFNFKRNLEKAKEHLLGLADGMLADGKLVDEEALFLNEWLRKHTFSEREWPFSVLFNRLRRVLEDGVIDEGERSELFTLLRDLAGPSFPGVAASTTLPLDRPIPDIAIAGFSYCLTGGFAYGPRPFLEKEVERLGGFVHGTVLTSTDYLLVGSVASRDWKHGSFGGKIERAMQYREKGHRIAIIGEDSWVDAIGKSALDLSWLPSEAGH